SQTSSATVVRTFGSSTRPQTVMVNLSYQKASDNSSYDGGDQYSDFVSSNVSYSFSVAPTGTTLAVSANVYRTNAAGVQSTDWGPTVSLTKSLMEKQLRASLASSYNETSGGDYQTRPVLNNRLNFIFTPKAPIEGGTSPHNLSVGINILNRLKDVEQQPAFSEYTATVNYTYRF